MLSLLGAGIGLSHLLLGVCWTLAMAEGASGERKLNTGVLNLGDTNLGGVAADELALADTADATAARVAETRMDAQPAPPSLLRTPPSAPVPSHPCPSLGSERELQSSTGQTSSQNGHTLSNPALDVGNKGAVIRKQAHARTRAGQN